MSGCVGASAVGLHRANNLYLGPLRGFDPGWHAHLGYLYYQIGKLDQAQQEFLTEKGEFPESGVFMDRMLAGLKKP